MTQIQISSYVDYLDYLSLEGLREEVKGIDHDCRWQEGDYCSMCDMINAANRDTLIQIILNNGGNTV